MYVKIERAVVSLFTSLRVCDGLQNRVNKIHLAYPVAFDCPALLISN